MHREATYGEQRRVEGTEEDAPAYATAVRQRLYPKCQEMFASQLKGRLLVPGDKSSALTSVRVDASLPWDRLYELELQVKLGTAGASGGGGLSSVVP